MLHLDLSRFVQPEMVQTLPLPDAELTLGVISLPPALGQIIFFQTSLSVRLNYQIVKLHFTILKPF